MISQTVCEDIISQLWHKKQVSKQNMMFRAFEAAGICKAGHHLAKAMKSWDAEVCEGCTPHAQCKITQGLPENNCYGVKSGREILEVR